LDALGMVISEKTLEAPAKVRKNSVCHAKRSEESRISKWLRPFASLRMTKKPILQEALLAIAINDVGF